MRSVLIYLYNLTPNILILFETRWEIVLQHVDLSLRVKVGRLHYSWTLFNFNTKLNTRILRRLLIYLWLQKWVFGLTCLSVTSEVQSEWSYFNAVFWFSNQNVSTWSIRFLVMIYKDLFGTLLIIRSFRGFPKMLKVISIILFI